MLLHLFAFIKIIKALSKYLNNHNKIFLFWQKRNRQKSKINKPQIGTEQSLVPTKSIAIKRIPNPKLC